MDILVLRRLEAFLAVARHQSFTAAAKELVLGQPFVSRQIKDLENQLGVALFVRKGRGVALTEAGRHLLDDAIRVKEHVDEMESRVRSLAEAQPWVLKLAFVNPLWEYVLPREIVSFRKRNPRVSVNLINVNDYQLFQLLIQQRIHIGFASRSPAPSGLRSAKFMDDELIVVAPASHPLADGKPHVADELKPFPFVLQPEPLAAEFAASLYLGLMKVEPNAALRIEGLGGTKYAIQLGLGLGIISSHVVTEELATGVLKRVAVTIPAYTRPLFIVTNPAIENPAAKSFLEHLKID